MVRQSKAIGTVAYLGGTPANLEKFTWAWGQMIQFNAECCAPGEYVNIDRATHSVHDVARNELVDRMMGDWLLMLDMDHEFEPDLAIRMWLLMQRKNLDVLTAIYTFRYAPHPPVIYHDEGEMRKRIVSWTPDMDIIPIDACGAGSLMVRRGVFERMVLELNERPFSRRGEKGEDHSFFIRCKELGIKSWCCPAIESFHLQVRPLSLADYEPGMIPTGKTHDVTGLRI